MNRHLDQAHWAADKALAINHTDILRRAVTFICSDRNTVKLKNPTKAFGYRMIPIYEVCLHRQLFAEQEVSMNSETDKR